MSAIPTILIIVLVKFSSSCENYGEYMNKVKYYEELITTNINKSNYYDLPNNADQFKPINQKVHDYGWVDFIIAGAGPTGSVMGNRLSEIKEWNVLVLEAGETMSEFGDIPGMYRYLAHSQFNWNYKSVSQKNACLGMTDQRCVVTRGKTVGGTSGINGLVYARGNKEDFDRWASQGNNGWSYKDILPYYIKSENCQIDGDPNYHGKGGYWNVKSRKSVSPEFSVYVQAYRQLLNCTLNNDYNGRVQMGISPLQFNIIRNKRQSAGTAFLTSVKNHRKNLKVLEKAFVTKILISPRRKSAYGVEFTYKGKLYHVRARKEVILSAGAISSPKILMLSGIGPKEDLNKLNISLIQDLPVGKILRDPPAFFGTFFQTNSSIPHKSLRENVEDYLANTGLYEVSGNSDGTLYFKSSYGKVESYPDVEVKLTSPPAIGVNMQTLFGLTKDTTDFFSSQINLESTSNVYIILLQPKSVGSLKLASSDPYVYPLIDLNILAEPQDMEVIYQAFQFVERLLDTPAMKAINASLVKIEYEQCKIYLTGSKDYWTCVIKLLTVSSYASVSTCPMGKNSSTSVVNDVLQVHGVKNLRVADLSVFPDPVSASPTATAVMIGEKLSDLIKAKNNIKISPIVNIFGKYS